MPSGTVPHMPVKVREAMCDITSECVLGICKGNHNASFLEEARSKLLLAYIPEGHNQLTEYTKRISLWKNG